ncbi:hypothetical protein PVA38_09370 [Streptococcus pneumoniae D39]|nr:hypothetical protein PVA38_09370 [Streptococcus pneumoniae D39]
MKYFYCLLYTSDAADEARSVDLGGRRIIKKTREVHTTIPRTIHEYSKSSSYI